MISALLSLLNGQIRNNIRVIFSSMIIFLLQGLSFSQNTYTFTNGAATGTIGPTQGQVNTAYLSTNLAGNVSVSPQGVQNWTVPANGMYRIETRGAQGYGSFGGKGATVIGDFSLTAGQVLKIVVGQKGEAPTSSNNHCGGGGGSFVTFSNNVPLIVAGGGGGSSHISFVASAHGTVSTSGNAGTMGTNNGAGGSGGSGGLVGNGAAGGGGLTGDGTGTDPGISFVNGAYGGIGIGVGGFGGGGGSTQNPLMNKSGGGGGYSGGGGSHSPATGTAVAGGGGSYNNGSNQSNTSGVNLGHGKVLISELCSISIIYSSPTGTAPLCSGGSATLSTNATSNYSWSTGATTSSIVISPTISSTYSLVATSSLSCSSSAVHNVSVISTPSLSVTSTPLNACAGKTVALVASGANSYTWTGGITNGVAFTASTTTGYTVTGQNPCGTSSTAIILTVNPNPTVTASVNNPTVCSGNTVVFSGGGASTYSWSNGVTNGAPYTANSSGNYTVTGTSTIGCSSTATVALSVIITPTALPLASSTLVCTGSNVTLSATGATGYTWLPGNTNSSSVVVTITAAATYTLIQENSSCSSVKTISVSINPPPVISVVNPLPSVCSGASATLTASGATTYTWTGGVVNGVSFVPGTTSGYTVNGSNACGTSSAVTTITVLALPVVTAIASQPTLCSGSSLTLTGSGAASYVWFPTTVTNGVGFVPSSSAGYTVIGTSAQGCTNSASTSVTLTPTPTLSPVLSTLSVCDGGSATITATGAANYSWSPSGASNSFIVVSPSVTTTYTVTKWNSNCVDTKTITLIVNPLPTVFAVASSTVICSLQTVTLSAGAGSSYTWIPYGGNLSQAIVSPGFSTNFTVVVSNGPCKASTTISITANANPTITVVPSSSVICSGETVTMTANGADSYLWTSPSLGTSSMVTHSPTTAINYQVSGTNTLTGCMGSTGQVIFVNSLPTLTVAATKTLVCTGGPSTVTVKGAASTYTYLWSSGVTTTATVVNPTITTVYSVTSTNTITTCKSTSMVTVNVFQPTFSVNSPTSACNGGSITLMASGANSYTWNGVSPFQSIIVSPTTPTFYVVAATSTLNGVSCISTNTVFVTIYPNPTITAAPSRTSICRYESVDLLAGGGSTYTWNTQFVGTPFNVTLTAQTGFTVTGTDQNGCKGTATLTIKVASCVGFAEQNLGESGISVFPNPNNGTFYILSEKDLLLRLTNDLGQLISEIKVHAGVNTCLQDAVKPGLYFISVVNEAGINRRKIVITN